MSALPHEDPPEPCPRTPTEIAEQWQYFTGPWHQTPDRIDYTRGVLESLRWIMGRRPESPVTEQVLDRIPTLKDIELEASRADNGVRMWGEEGRNLRQRHNGRYLQGCEAALFWATGAGDDSI